VTDELRNQRRWQAVAAHIFQLTLGRVDPMIMPLSDGGGMLVIIGQKSFHWFNFKAAVCYDFGDADRPEILVGNRFVARLDTDSACLAKFILEEMSKP
jgi:hypothetical protein